MSTAKPTIPVAMIAKWQRVVDLAAKLAQVPASLVMKTTFPDHSVLVSSRSEGNPYDAGQSFVLNSKLYCYSVLKRCDELVVRDALSEPDWSDNQDIEFGMTFYVGYPLSWPDGTLFGTICMLNRRDNELAFACRELLKEFKGVIEGDLALLSEAALRQAAERELQSTLQDMERRIAERTGELEDANTALRVLLARAESSRLELEDSFFQQIKCLVLPHVAKLRSSRVSGASADIYLDLLEANLKNIATSSARHALSELEKLTPTETDIAQMIMHGQKTKDIAKALSREVSTIDFHRNNIRKKLGIEHRSINLRSYLRSIQHYGVFPHDTP